MRDIARKKAHDAMRHSERMKQDIPYRMRKILNTIRHRCDTDKHKASRYYQGKGIQNFLTIDDLIFLWNRDDAATMRRASIDRVDPLGNYEMANVRFLELSENSRRSALRGRVKPTVKRRRYQRSRLYKRAPEKRVLTLNEQAEQLASEIDPYRPLRQSLHAKPAQEGAI